MRVTYSLSSDMMETAVFDKVLRSRSTVLMSWTCVGKLGWWKQTKAGKQPSLRWSRLLQHE